jgi:putative component of membrane protein insertase Oxa1/YidC/SpoIIIJ protein YidD
VRKCSFIYILFLSFSAESSVIDSAYRSQSLKNSSVTQKVYSKILKSGYYTDCVMIPSDSTYVAQLSAKCGMHTALVKGIGRFFNEPDVGELGFKIISGFEKVSYEDQATDCSFDL